jgi:hypothetical protein
MIPSSRHSISGAFHRSGGEIKVWAWPPGNSHANA